MKLYRNLVAPQYFDVMRIGLLDGRDFTDQDRGETMPVAIVNREFARRYFEGRSPIGRHLTGVGSADHDRRHGRDDALPLAVRGRAAVLLRAAPPAVRRRHRRRAACPRRAGEAGLSGAGHRQRPPRAPGDRPGDAAAADRHARRLHGRGLFRATDRGAAARRPRRARARARLRRAVQPGGVRRLHGGGRRLASAWRSAPPRPTSCG